MSADSPDSRPARGPQPTPSPSAPEVGATQGTAAQGTKKRRRWLKRTLVITALAVPLLIVGLWIGVHTFPWMGPLVADTLRAIIGKENVTRLEDFAYAVQDKINLTFRSDRKPRARWKVDPKKSKPKSEKKEPAPAIPAPQEDPEEEAPPQIPPFSPEDVGPVLESFSAEGDGVWVPIRDPRRPEEPPRLYKTLLHPDKSRSWAEVFVVAVDLRSVAVMPVMGYQEPRTEKEEAEDYVRHAKIPRKHWDSLLAAFNGGFMAEHGEYGVYFDGITFLDPRPEACTLARFDDGHFEIATWNRIKDQKNQMTWYRQAPNCMYEDGEMHPALKIHAAKKWGATLDGRTVIRRSAVGLSRDGQILYVGISNHTNAKVMALGMHHAGGYNVAQMDVNWSYPKFVTYEPDENGKLIPVALADGFEFSKDLYLRERSMRDFFYLAREEEVTVHSPNEGKTTSEKEKEGPQGEKEPLQRENGSPKEARAEDQNAKDEHAENGETTHKGNDASEGVTREEALEEPTSSR